MHTHTHTHRCIYIWIIHIWVYTYMYTHIHVHTHMQLTSKSLRRAPLYTKELPPCIYNTDKHTHTHIHSELKKTDRQRVALTFISEGGPHYVPQNYPLVYTIQTNKHTHTYTHIHSEFKKTDRQRDRQRVALTFISEWGRHCIPANYPLVYAI